MKLIQDFTPEEKRKSFYDNSTRTLKNILDEIPEYGEPTAEFLEVVEDLYQFLNSVSLEDKKYPLFDSPFSVKDHKLVSEMPDRAKGTQRLYKFENGYGASVIQFGNDYPDGRFHWLSYTNSENEWELAVIRWTEEEFELDYITPIANDVEGYLSKAEVENYLNKIKSL